MKRIIFGFIFLCSSCVLYSQTITDTATLRQRIDEWIVPNSSITASKLHTILVAMAGFYAPGTTITNPYPGVDSVKFGVGTISYWASSGASDTYDLSKFIVRRVLNSNGTQEYGLNIFNEVVDSVATQLVDLYGENGITVRLGGKNAEGIDSTIIGGSGSGGGGGVDSLFIVLGDDMDSLKYKKNTVTYLGGLIQKKDGLLSGGSVVWSGQGLKYYILSAVYRIGNTIYRKGLDSTTLNTADATFGRRDAIGVNTSNASFNIPGDPSAMPQDPIGNPATQLILTYVLINKNDTIPVSAGEKIIYDENTEATATAGGLTANFNGTSNPYHLAKTTDISGFGSGQFAQYAQTVYSISDYSTLVLHIRNKAAIAAGSNVGIIFLGPSGNSNVVYLNTSHGYSKTVVGAYQTVVVPISAFSFANNNITTLRLYFAGTTNATGLYVDYITLQKNISSGTSNIVSGLYKKNGTDSVFYTKDGLSIYAFRDTGITSLKTVNFQDIRGTGNAVVTALPTPDFDYYLSNTGNNGNDGLSSKTPKATLKSIDTLINNSTLPLVRVGIEGGSFFNQDNNEISRGGVTVGIYNADKADRYKYPVSKGTTVHNSGWSFTGTATYNKSITHRINVGTGTALGSYSSLYVIEVDTAMEKVLPIAAMRYFKKAVSQAAVDTIPGTYYFTAVNPSSSPTTVYIHTSDGSSPNSNSKYRYEIVTEGGMITRNLTVGSYGDFMKIEKLVAWNFGQGVGAIASQRDSVYMTDGATVGNAIHSAVLGNWSTINNWAFIGGDKSINGTAVVFYRDSGKHDINTIKNSIFIGNPFDIYTHTSSAGAVTHKKLVVRNTWLYDSESTAIGADNTDSVDLSYLYSKDGGRWINSNAPTAFVKNSVIVDFSTLSWHTKNITFNNSFFKPVSKYVNEVVAFDLTPGDKATFNNSIFHMINRDNSVIESGNLTTIVDTTSRIVARRNVFIIDVPASGYVDLFTVNPTAGIGTSNDSIDYNAYILVGGHAKWSTTNAALNGGLNAITSFATWKTQSGQDSHSVFIDLTNTPAGLQQIYIDPAAGNYNLTSTAQADMVRAIGAGMITPIGRFPITPSKDLVYEMVTNNTLPSVTDVFYDPTGSENDYLHRRDTTNMYLRAIAGTGISITGTYPNLTFSFSGTITPAGSNTQVQYNNSGALGASSDLTFTSATKSLQVGGSGGITIENNGGNRNIIGAGALNIFQGGTQIGLMSSSVLDWDNEIKLGNQGASSIIGIKSSSTLAIGTSNVNEIYSNPTRNDAPTHLLIRGLDYAYGGQNWTSNLYMMAGKNTTNNDFGSLILQHDGTGSKGNIGIGTNTPNVSAELDVSQLYKGFLPPRMTTGQRDSIVRTVLSYSVTAGGTGYSTATATASSGIVTAVPGTVSLNAGVVLSVAPGTFTGKYYGSTTPTVSIGGPGTGATATVNLAPLPPGLTIFNTTTNKIETWDGSTWQAAW